jgi:hypothetical protein
MKDSVPRIAALVFIELTIFIYNLSESFWIADSTERQTDACEESSGSYESLKDSTALRRGSDVDSRPTGRSMILRSKTPSIHPLFSTNVGKNTTANHILVKQWLVTFLGHAKQTRTLLHALHHAQAMWMLYKKAARRSGQLDEWNSGNKIATSWLQRSSETLPHGHDRQPSCLTSATRSQESNDWTRI